MTNNIPFSDRDLYDVAVKQIYDSKGLKPGDKLPINEKFTVTDIQHDTQTGFDAMAVKDDKGNIMVIYGGTAGASDIVTDAQIAGTYLGATPSPAQFEQAKAFRNRVVKDNPGADITLTGHSLGGGMSNAVALDSGDKAVNFNPAPLPYDMSTVYGNGVDRTDIINYQTSGDPLRAGTMFAGGYLPGQAKVFTGGDGFLLSKEQHNMENVRFDSEGNLVDVHGNRVSDMPNTNLNTGNKYLDEAIRGSNMTGFGVGVIGVGGITMATGAFLITFGGPVGMVIGSVLMIAGAIVCVVGAVAALIGLFRTLVSGVKFLIEQGAIFVKWLSEKINEVIKNVVNGLVEVGKKALSAVKQAYQWLKDGAIAIVTKVGEVANSVISAVYEKVQEMGRMIAHVGEQVKNMIQQGINKLIEFKDKLFEMTYSFIRKSVQMLFQAGEIIELLGSAATQIMADIVTLQWDKIIGHVIEKIDEFQHEASRDFKLSKRGFDHELAKEIGNELQELARKLNNFSERVYKVQETFKESESTIESQLKGLGGRLCLSY